MGKGFKDELNNCDEVPNNKIFVNVIRIPRDFLAARAEDPIPSVILSDAENKKKSAKIARFTLEIDT